MSSSIHSPPESDTSKTELAASSPLCANMDTFTRHPSNRPSVYDTMEQGGELSPPSSPVTVVAPHRLPPILSSSPVTTTFSSNPLVRKSVLETRRDMFNRYQPYKKRTGAPPPLELRFAARSMGRSSYTDMSLEDVAEGHDILHRGLSHLSDRVLLKALGAKRAFRDSILYRVGQTKAEIESAERQKDLLNEVLTEAQGNLDNAESQLSLLRQVVDERGLEEATDDAGYYHAVYADELVALTIAGAQVERMEHALQTKQGERDDVAASLSPSDSGGSDSEPFTGLLSPDDTVE